METINCPGCGLAIEVRGANKKGQGAAYGNRIRSLGEDRGAFLAALAALGAINETTAKPSAAAKQRVNEARKAAGRYPKAFNGRLSELLSLGYVGMAMAEIRLYDREGMGFRPRKKPVWWITPAGLAALHAADPAAPVAQRTLVAYAPASGPPPRAQAATGAASGGGMAGGPEA